jgi:hypothetical protein
MCLKKLYNIGPYIATTYEAYQRVHPVFRCSCLEDIEDGTDGGETHLFHCVDCLGLAYL